MKKKVLLALCLLASLNGFSQTVTFDAAAKKMTIEGLTAGTLGTIITDGSGTTDNLRETSFSYTTPDENGSVYVNFNDDAAIETLIITGELNGDDIQIISNMGRRWIKQETADVTSEVWDSNINQNVTVHSTKWTQTVIHAGGLKYLDISGAKIVKDATPANNEYFNVAGGNYTWSQGTVALNSINVDGGGVIGVPGYNLKDGGTGGVYSVENENEIGDAMFAGCNTLVTIILPETLTKIGKAAFYSLMKMEEINIPASVESIGSYAFWQAFNMDAVQEGVPTTIIRFEGKENKVTLEANALVQYDNQDPMIIYGGEPVKIAAVESSVSLLSDYAFDPVIEENYKAGFVKGIATPPNKYWTFSNGVDVIVPDNVKVYTCQIVNGETDIRELTDALVVDGKRTIKRNNGVLIACPDDATSNAYELVAKYNADLVGTTPATTNANDYPNNSLVPVLTKSHYEPGEYYMLYHGKWVAMASDATKVPACKALLKK